MKPTSTEVAQPTSWSNLLEAFAQEGALLPSDWAPLFNPLRAGGRDAMMVVGQLGQTLDGRIATITGHSKYINGPSGLTHLHRLRAVVDAVVVGVGTAVADDPRLNVRLVSGKHPARVVIDPHARLKPDSLVWSDDGTRRIVIVADQVKANTPPGVEVLSIPATNGHLAPADILRALFACGFTRILIEAAPTRFRASCLRAALTACTLLLRPSSWARAGPAFLCPRSNTWIKPSESKCTHTHLKTRCCLTVTCLPNALNWFEF